MGSERRVVTHCSFCYNDVFEDGTHASAEAGRACARDSDLARVTAQRAAAATLQEAERAVLDAAKEHLAAEDAWSSSQGEYEEQQAAFARYCDAQDALYETTKALLEKERALLALRAGA